VGLVHKRISVSIKRRAVCKRQGMGFSIQVH
jgi:hypothetical protein